MTRPQEPAPPGTMLAKTSRGTWVALTEEWSASGELLALHPRREPGRERAPIVQKRERIRLLIMVLADRTRQESETESES